MAEERTIKVDIGDGDSLVIVAEQVGPALVADDDVVARLGAVTGSIEKVSREVLQAIKNAGPDAATVELGFGLAVEAGQLITLFGKAKGDATMKVTLEWKRAGHEG